MKATNNIHSTEAITHPTTGFECNENAAAGVGQTQGTQAGAAEQGQTKGKPESELRAAARRHGLTLKELADRMGVNYGYLSSVASGRRPWSPMLRERAMAVLGEVPGQGVVYRQGGLVKGESTYIRERARELGMSPAVQARVEAVLEGPARVEPVPIPGVDCRALWDRMDAHEISQNEVARRAGISSGHLSQIMNGQRTPSGEVLRKLHGVLFQPTAAELVVPAEVKVMAWKKGGRNGVVVRGAGGPGAGGTVRIGGRVPWGAEVEYAYRAGYDSRGRVSVTHLVDERGYSVMLTKPEPDGAGPGEDLTGV